MPPPIPGPRNKRGQPRDTARQRSYLRVDETPRNTHGGRSQARVELGLSVSRSFSTKHALTCATSGSFFAFRLIFARSGQLFRFPGNFRTFQARKAGTPVFRRQNGARRVLHELFRVAIVGEQVGNPQTVHFALRHGAKPMQNPCKTHGTVVHQFRMQNHTQIQQIGCK